MKEELEARKCVFRRKTTLRECLDIAREATQYHGFFQHYTSMDRLVSMILYQQFWLTRGDSSRLDDQLEWQKYGRQAEWRRTYIGCFSHVNSENAAMWGLYGPKNHDSVRISIPNEKMVKWISDIQSAALKPVVRKNGKSPWVDGKEIQDFEILFGDLVYLAVDDGERYDRNRSNCASWCDVNTDEPIDNLPRQLYTEDIVGWVKDYEWKDERESRIVLKVGSGEKVQTGNVAIAIPLYVLEAMTVTFSPWATDDEIESDKRLLLCVLHKAGIENSTAKKFRRSFLSGALQKWEKRG